MPKPVLHVHAKTATDELALALAALPERFGLVREFADAATAEALHAIAALQLPSIDLTHLPFLTIDPAGSTDLDQAMHIETHGSGYRVFYAIADVPAFVVPGGALDAEARHRGQTIYAPDGRIPLHPAVISEGAASLLAGQERSAFVWEIALDAEGEITSTTVTRARIRSRQQLSYEQAQSALDTAQPSETLRLLKVVGTARIELERQRGGASLNLPSVEIEEVGNAESGGGYRLVRRSPLPIEDWNAQISLMTGMAAAQLMLGARIGLLRTMPQPEPATITSFRHQTHALGHPWPEDMPYGEYLRTLDLQDPRELAIMHAAGSLFRGAGYTAFDGTAPANTMQAAVAAPYAHVTAPLRRLVDRFTLVLCAAICANEPVPQWVSDALTELPGLMTSSDQKEGALSRAAIDAVEAAVLSRRVGEVFTATVISAGTGSSGSATAGNGAANGRGRIQLTDPAVTARCTGNLTAGTVISVRLVEATIETGIVSFEAVSTSQHELIAN
ncbi:RNB domain-containing ribonuclease [Leifsonia kafniensis]|uniref:RNB domain-containing ribonuclease n=1 Tax=Leifsonia kafniensis TaxID=475957 RepID=A0ABP7L768_9MICO